MGSEEDEELELTTSFLASNLHINFPCYNGGSSEGESVFYGGENSSVVIGPD